MPTKLISGPILVIVFIVGTLATSLAAMILGGPAAVRSFSGFVLFTVKYAWAAGAVITALVWLAYRKKEM